ncbi:MAG TPA: hypothetical protein VMZ00_08375 [Sporichthya sp.]|nr:hypothetical protein [Sporichthya sp.]
MVMLVMALVVALGATATSVSIGNLRGSTSAQQAGTALDAAEAGIAQATTYIRTNGTRKLRCSPTCTTNPWNPPTASSPGNPVSANVAGGGRWEAWIAPIPPVSAAEGGRYLIHSAGTAGGPAQRIIETEVAVSPIDLPKAVFGRTINLGGTVDIRQISVFSTGCVFKRSKVTATNAATEMDLAYGVPPGVHSSQIITNSQGSGQFCPGTNQPIHNSLLGALGVCNTAYPYDQDRLGAPFLTALNLPIPLLPTACNALTANPAYQPHYVAGGQVDVSGSFIRDDAALFKAFGIKRPALTDSELEQLRATAQAQGNYYTTTTGWTVPTDPHAVLFFDLNGGKVDLSPLGNSPLFARARLDASSPLCLDASLLVVVAGGDAMLNSNTQLAASVYLSGSAPYGHLEKANGTANHIGMLYADTLDLTGNFQVSLDTCYVENPPPALFTVTPGTYRELDR